MEDLILRTFYVSGNTLVIVARLPRDNQHDREQQTLLKSINGHDSKYLSGNNLPRISVIRGKVFPDKYFDVIAAF